MFKVVPSSYAGLAMLFLGALLSTLTVWAVLSRSLSPDASTDYEHFYDPVATAILEGRGPTLNGVPATGYPPGYPLLLAAARVLTHPLGLSKGGAMLGLNLGSIAASSVLLYEIAALLFGPLPSVTAYVLWLSYPFMLAISKAGLTEAPFCALLYAALFLVFRFVWGGKRPPGQAIVAGAFLGSAILVRPIAIGIPALLVLVLAFAKTAGDLKSRLRFIAGMAAGCVFLLTPWETWVFARTGQWVLLSTNGVGTMRDGLTFAVNSAKVYRAQIAVSPDVKEVQLNVLKQRAGLNSVREIAVLLRQEWRKSPWAVTKLMFTKAARSWYGTDSGRLDPYILVVQALYLVAALAGGLLAASDPRMRRNMAPVVALIGYFWLMTTAFLSILRYMLPAMGLVFILTAAGIESLLSKRFPSGQEGSLN